jgi:hypothetical protein
MENIFRTVTFTIFRAIRRQPAGSTEGPFLVLIKHYHPADSYTPSAGTGWHASASTPARTYSGKLGTYKGAPTNFVSRPNCTGRCGCMVGKERGQAAWLIPVHWLLSRIPATIVRVFIDVAPEGRPAGFGTQYCPPGVRSGPVAISFLAAKLGYVQTSWRSGQQLGAEPRGCFTYSE